MLDVVTFTMFEYLAQALYWKKSWTAEWTSESISRLEMWTK